MSLSLHYRLRCHTTSSQYTNKNNTTPTQNIPYIIYNIYNIHLQHLQQNQETLHYRLRCHTTSSQYIHKQKQHLANTKHHLHHLHHTTTSQNQENHHLNHIFIPWFWKFELFFLTDFFAFWLCIMRLRDSHFIPPCLEWLIESRSSSNNSIVPFG